MPRLVGKAKRLNSYEELLFLKQIIGAGSSAKRQRSVFQEKGNLQAVVDALVQAWKTDMPN